MHSRIIGTVVAQERSGDTALRQVDDDLRSACGVAAEIGGDRSGTAVRLIDAVGISLLEQGAPGERVRRDGEQRRNSKRTECEDQQDTSSEADSPRANPAQCGSESISAADWRCFDGDCHDCKR